MRAEYLSVKSVIIFTLNLLNVHTKEKHFEPGLNVKCSDVSMSVVLGGEWRDIYKLNMRLIHLGVIPVIL